MRSEDEVIFTLESIFNLGKALSVAKGIDEVFKVFLLSLMGKLRMAKAVGFIIDKNELKPIYSCCSEGVTVMKINPRFIPHGLTRLNDSVIRKFGRDLRSFIRRNRFDYLVPVIWSYKGGSENLGLIFLGGRGKLTNKEIEYVNFVANFTAISLKVMLSIDSLKKNVYTLTMLNEFMQNVFLKNDEGGILNLLALTLIGHFRVNRVVIVKFDGRAHIIFSYPQGQVKTKFLREISKRGGRSDTPIFFYEGNMGRFALLLEYDGRDGKKSFSEDEKNLIRTFFTVSMNAIENLKMLNLRHDVELAYEIQKNLLPREFPENPRFEIGALFLPSRVVSGDYYDVINLSDDEVLLAIADVCGKGLSASLLMSNLQALLHSFILFTTDLVNVVGLLNKMILAHTSSEQFITFFICKVDLKNFVLEYVNAGHNLPILFSNSRFTLLDEGGPVLGVIESEYKLGKIELKRGDLLFLYTDGVTEAINVKGEELGVEKLIEFIKRHRNLSSGEIINSVGEMVSSFSRGVEQNDDITVLVFKIK
ncbi:sigma-B regulation protein RsbU (phosphoserine phosphatase) [Candidatus Thermokryptus mobilis]|uniref:Sigma-B regulation protein RsbU (Phosphoserine phosphatase) n=1 Tax=Candidatus Thermokryptus mobilis TaxID=1643428 RepID=A0A0S4MU85_9BACT|nr:PP2C family protein-serine/threonine phosphatase [Candidatus Thermokryptus mobilis]CUU02468.1 sigma-B regulation protein RsbU (phosphoserine phosphatase) [Candidatus Thermokryptus mobilis]